MTYVYRVEGSVAHTHACAAGPWGAGLQHGGAPASLIAWAVQRIPTLEPMHVARMTVDLLRPVPIAPLDIRTQIVRDGRRIQLIAASLLHEGVEVVRASVLKVRDKELALPETAVEETVALPGPDHGTPAEGVLADSTAAFIKGLDLKVVKGAFREPGPAAIWFRAHRPVVEGEPISPLMRVAMTADFCNGVSSVLDFRRWTFINADLTISLARMPVGEWILLDARTWLDGGAGIAFAKLGDQRGYFGRAAQSLLIEPR
jgi:Thioesterase-like superfamily